MFSRIVSRLSVASASGSRAYNALRSTTAALPSRRLVSTTRSFFATATSSPSASAYKEMAEFLKEEVELEKSVQRFGGKIPSIRGFDVQHDGANITLTRSYKDEKIVVKFNVNHSIDADALPPTDDAQPQREGADQPEHTAMVSRPSFTVEIQRPGRSTLALHCQFFVQDDEDDHQPPGTAAGESGEALKTSDVFEIDEVAFLDGNEWKEATYSVSGEVMDGNLYDLLMSALEERGIGEEFSKDLTKFATSYEHKQYISFLEKLKTYVS